MPGEVSPWVGMWTCPRSTIRALVNLKPKYGVFRLAWIYAFQYLLILCSYWSFGITFSFPTILMSSLLLSPFLGIAWIYFNGWIFYFTGRWLAGKAPACHIRAAVAWSKIPCVIALVMWIILMINDSESVFINGVSGTSMIFVNLILFILGVWSLVLIIESVREVQGFSLLRAIYNVFLAWLISWVFSLFAFFVFRYVYISI